MTKFTVYAMFSFEVDTDEADADLIEVDAVYEAAMLVTPSGFTLEEIVEREDAEEMRHLPPYEAEELHAAAHAVMEKKP